MADPTPPGRKPVVRSKATDPPTTERAHLGRIGHAAQLGQTQQGIRLFGSGPRLADVVHTALTHRLACETAISLVEAHVRLVGRALGLADDALPGIVERVLKVLATPTPPPTDAPDATGPTPG